MYINRGVTQGQSGVGKIKRRPFLETLTAIYWKTVVVTMQVHNGYKKWCPLELFDSHFVQWQSPSRI